jgi:hydrogenase large subunit
MDDPAGFLFPGGVILDRNLEAVEPLDARDPEQIQEFIAHSWYDYGAGKTQGLHPYEGETRFNYSGPEPPYTHLEVEKSYSWLKAPRWRGRVMEVGPLARVLMLYANGHAQTRELVHMTLKRLDLPVAGLYSTLGRTAARTLETKILVDAMAGWYDALLANIRQGDLKTFDASHWEPETWPKQARGIGFTEAPRGALAHWVVIEEGKIANYQAVVPSTWNAGPRDATGQPGPYEAALMGHVLANPDQPIEILRTIHSFDPCIACAVHILDPRRNKSIQVRIR